MKMVYVDFQSLEESINSLNEIAQKGVALRFHYSIKAAGILIDLKGFEKEEAITNLNNMFEMINLLNQLMKKTTIVLTLAKQNYMYNDELLAEQI